MRATPLRELATMEPQPAVKRSDAWQLPQGARTHGSPSPWWEVYSLASCSSNPSMICMSSMVAVAAEHQPSQVSQSIVVAHHRLYLPEPGAHHFPLGVQADRFQAGL